MRLRVPITVETLPAFSSLRSPNITNSILLVMLLLRPITVAEAGSP